MARIAGVDLPRNKRIIVALTYIHGIGRTVSAEIIEKCGLDPDMRSDSLSEVDVRNIRQVIEDNYKVEGDLRRQVQLNIKRLQASLLSWPTSSSWPASAWSANKDECQDT